MLLTCIGATSGINSILMLPLLVLRSQKIFWPLSKETFGGFGRRSFQFESVLSILFSSMNASMAATPMVRLASFVAGGVEEGFEEGGSAPHAADPRMQVAVARVVMIQEFLAFMS